MRPKRIPEPWLRFFRELDQQITERVELVCLGAFALSILYNMPRPTADVDVLDIAPPRQRKRMLELAGEGSPLHKRFHVYIQHVTVAPAIDGYETRLTEMFPTVLERLRLFALDPYDLALSKIERNSSKDREDVKYLAQVVPLDLQVLTERYRSSVRPFLAHLRREDLTLQLWVEMVKEMRR